MKPMLVSISGPLSGKTFPLTDEEMSIGRDSSNHISIKDKSVSRHHCLIKKQAGTFRLIDLDSYNGTFINNTPVTDHLLSHGDQIITGNAVFVFALTDQEEGRVAPAVARLDDELIASTTTQLEPDDVVYLRPEKNRETLPFSARMVHDLNSLLKISTRINSFRDSESLQHYVLEAALETIPAQRGALLSLSGGLEQITSIVGKSGNAELVQPIRVSRTIAEKVLREGVAVLCNDLSENAVFASAQSLQASKIRSVLCVPLLIGKNVVGLIYLDTDDAASLFDDGHLQLLTAIAGISSVALENVARIEWLKRENERLLGEINVDHSMIGESSRMRAVYKVIEKAAPSDATVLILGDSGTGKELAARAFHARSKRAGMPFIAINCAVLTETLLESELFGHEKGAFTGAIAQKRGKLEVADGGTLFLDEVGELPQRIQAKLLRVLQEREFERVGGTRPIKVDIRLVSATNKSLEQAVKEGSFRKDLYYRLNVVSLLMPPLRERREDIALLANYFTAKYSKECKRQIRGFTNEARESLLAYDWPGNVRELENMIERAIVLGTTDFITLEDLPETIVESYTSKPGTTNFYQQIKDMKKNLILRVIKESAGNYTAAAKTLGIHPTNLHRLIRTLELKSMIQKS